MATKKKHIYKAIGYTALTLTISVLCLSGVYYPKLSSDIYDKFDGKRWSLPAVVYARPMELFPGKRLSLQALERELQLSGYRLEEQENGAGSYSIYGDSIQLISRGFHFPSGFEPSKHLQISFSGADQLKAIISQEDSTDIPFTRLDPMRIGSFHPTVHEDRVVVKREEIPEQLIQTLLAIEDRDFYSHHGINPSAILRAVVTNIRVGKAAQGGSTLTQQLVKNFFLSRERTISRKAKEAIMALLLEYHFTKDEILTAYINEVFLGQDGNRAIHGFGLASQYYFHRDINDISPEQIAMLVGMVKGPTYYNPHRNPKNCLERRTIILQQMVAQNLIDPATYTLATQQPLTEEQAVPQSAFNRFPAFLDMVREQLKNEFNEEDLKTDGLQIITTLDPQIQETVETELQTSISSLETKKNTHNIEGAAIITNKENGEILAIAGGKNPIDHGFNRALNAQRPIGSLIKPAVYLTALNHGFNLASPLKDEALSIPLEHGGTWRPKNYDRKEHGVIPLFSALIHSYNLATVYLGMEIGIENVLITIKGLGYHKELKPYPSLLLCAINMSPVEVSQMFQTISSGGFYTSLRAINSVMGADHKLITRYSLAVEQIFSSASIFLLSHTMQKVVTEGTGKALLNSPLADHRVAGKTGTSDGLRDSWFAGFTGDHLAVVWLGRDDNTPTPLTGSTGALISWSKIMTSIQSSPLELTEPPNVLWQKNPLGSEQTSYTMDKNDVMLPFLVGTEPPKHLKQPKSFKKTTVKDGVPGFFDTLQDWLN